MKKIPRKEYDLLSSENKAILQKLGIEVDDSDKCSRQSRRVTDSLLEQYACIIETECKLCRSISITVFSMEGTGGLLVSHESSIEAVEGMTIKTRSETVVTCPACHDYLKLMSQEDLIALTIRVAKGECRYKKER